MSSINGDKARFHRIRKSKVVRRERMRVLRKKLVADAAAALKAVEVYVRHDQDNPLSLQSRSGRDGRGLHHSGEARGDSAGPRRTPPRRVRLSGGCPTTTRECALRESCEFAAGESRETASRPSPGTGFGWLYASHSGRNGLGDPPHRGKIAAPQLFGEILQQRQRASHRCLTVLLPTRQEYGRSSTCLPPALKPETQDCAARARSADP